VTGTATSVSGSSISTTFNLNQKDQGKYNIIVTNPDGRSDILPDAFTIGDAAPVVNSIIPDTAEMNDTESTYTINGQNFKTGVTVTFLKGSTVISCINGNAVDSTKISCGPISFTLSNDASAGIWDVKVLNIDGGQSGILSQKFTVTNDTSIAH
jgi:hypothetical protein